MWDLLEAREGLFLFPAAHTSLGAARGQNVSCHPVSLAHGRCEVPAYQIVSKWNIHSSLGHVVYLVFLTLLDFSVPRLPPCLVLSLPPSKASQCLVNPLAASVHAVTWFGLYHPGLPFSCSLSSKSSLHKTLLAPDSPVFLPSLYWAMIPGCDSVSRTRRWAGWLQDWVWCTSSPQQGSENAFFFFFLQEPKGSEYKVKLPPSLRS